MSRYIPSQTFTVGDEQFQTVEFVAKRDIAANEELLIDYCDGYRKIFMCNHDLSFKRKQRKSVFVLFNFNQAPTTSGCVTSVDTEEQESPCTAQSATFMTFVTSVRRFQAITRQIRSFFRRPFRHL